MSVFTCWFHDVGTLFSWVIFTDFGTSSYPCSLSNSTPVSLLCWHVVVRTHYPVASCISLFPLLSMIVQCDMFSRNTGIICIWQLLFLRDALSLSWSSNNYLVIRPLIEHLNKQEFTWIIIIYLHLQNYVSKIMGSACALYFPCKTIHLRLTVCWTQGHIVLWVSTHAAFN